MAKILAEIDVMTKKSHFLNNDTNEITMFDERYYKAYDKEKGLDVWLPSATTILDVAPKGKGFEMWLKDVGVNASLILERAGLKGDLTHDLAENLLITGELSWLDENDKPKCDVEVWNMALKVQEFCNRFVDEVIAVEVKIAPIHLGFGGRIDLIVKIGKENWLIDLKTGNGIYETHHMQLAAYVKGWNSLTQKKNLKIDRMGILWLNAATRTEGKGKTIQGKGWQIIEPIVTKYESDSKGDYKEVKLSALDSMESLYEDFEHIRHTYLKYNPIPKPQILIYPTKAKLDRFKPLKTRFEMVEGELVEIPIENIEAKINEMAEKIASEKEV